ncbi:MAG: aldo/keto reductase [Pseudomonadota bacterium]
MQSAPLGRTDIRVSRLCLGSMTWGSQNSLEEGGAQIDQALERGVDFIDTAEMYPTTPLSSETFGRTEEIIGAWIARSGKRNAVKIATKILGPGFRWGRAREAMSGGDLREAVEGSLKRLGVETIDLQQLHWPNRGSYHFRQSWSYDARRTRGTKAEIRAHMEDMLGAAADLIAAGKIRSFGLSNETAWGVGQWIETAERAGLPRVASIQNEYSLLHRSFDLDLGETAHHEGVGLLAYSPLAAGLLTGKYGGGARPEGSRATIRPDLHGRMTAQAEEAVRAYGAIAARHGLNPATMAIAWCLTRPFMTSVIIGATTPTQLDASLDGAETTLSDEVMAEIQETYRRFPAPF